MVGTKETLKTRPMRLSENSGLLFPTSDSIELTDLPVASRPDQLVLIDGTWPQAKAILNASPRLQRLRRFRLAPTQPGKYQIRLEPTATSLSTVEATVSALRTLEPETLHLDQLLVAFDVMIQKQLDHPAVKQEHYSGGAKNGWTFNVPKLLLGDPSKIVVAYGEANYQEPDLTRHAARRPVYWCAENLGTKKSFATAIETKNKLPESFLKHLGLSDQTFTHAMDSSTFCRSWNEFFGDAECLVTYNHGSIRLLKTVFESNLPEQGSSLKSLSSFVTLKSINFAGISCRSLPELNSSLGIPAPKVSLNAPRASRRLSGTIELLNYVRSSIGPH